MYADLFTLIQLPQPVVRPALIDKFYSLSWLTQTLNE